MGSASEADVGVGDAPAVSNVGRPKGDTAGRILSAAMDNIARMGVDAFRLGDVSKALGISPPAIYAHFPGGRGELIDRIAQEGVRGMEAFFPRRGGTAREELIAGISGLVHFYAKNRAFLQIMLIDFSSPGGHPSISRQIGASRGNFANGAFLPMFHRLDAILEGCAAYEKATPVSANVFLNVLVGATALNLIYPPRPAESAAEIATDVELIVRDLALRYLGISEASPLGAGVGGQET